LRLSGQAEATTRDSRENRRLNVE
jgi:transposase